MRRYSSSTKEGPTDRRSFWTRLSTIAAVIIGTVAIAMVGLLHGSNCGGNSAALAICDVCCGILGEWELRNPGEAFRYGHVDPGTRERLAALGDSPFTRSARFLIKADEFRIDSARPGQVVLVCDRPYDNVPDYFLWRSPMAHAVGYSTGKTGLISPEEFSRLDLNGFVDVRADVAKIFD